VLPLLFHHLRREYGALGDVAGRLYSWNTVGSLLGALLGGYALLFWLDLHHVFRLAMMGAALAAVAATARLYEIGRVPAAVFVLAPVVAGIALLTPWDPVRLSSGLFRNRLPTNLTYLGPDALFSSGKLPEVLFYDDDPAVSVAVHRQEREPAGPTLSIVNNGKSDGGVPTDYLTMGLAAILPALMADEPERVFVVGYGTGVTAGELAALDSSEEVLVAEISPGIIEAAPFFEASNLQASKSPKVRILRGDAYRTLLKSEGHFDVIASMPSNPWITGVEMLFSSEFLEAARDRLAPGGVYAQWFHTYETDTATIAMVLRTYASIFDHVAVWYAEGFDLILLGITNPDAALDVDRLERRMSRPDFKAGLARSGIHSLEALLAHELLPLGVIHAARLSGELHTLLHPRLSDLAARAFFVGQNGRIPFTAGLEAARAGRRNSLIRRYRDRMGGQLSELARVRIVEETCLHRSLECVTLLAQWAHEVPASTERRRIIEQLRGNALMSANMDFDLVGPLARFYDDEPLSLDAAKSLKAAMAASTRFTEYYHHGAPFRRQALAEVWQRCAMDPAQRDRCHRARAQLEHAIGDLEVDVGRLVAPQPARGG
jgi:SAM-dependent methyltransferase